MTVTAATAELSSPEEIALVLSRASLLHLFTHDELTMLGQFAVVRHLRPGMDLYIEGAPASSFSVIAAGTVGKKRGRSPRPIGPVTMLGTLPLLRREERLRRRTAGLVALSEVTAIEISYRVLDRLAPERKELFLDSVAEQAVELIERLEQQLAEGR
jgi:CRP-like cAMP-binding protein